jgi:hypothetical protein
MLLAPEVAFQEAISVRLEAHPYPEVQLLALVRVRTGLKGMVDLQEAHLASTHGKPAS